MNKQSIDHLKSEIEFREKLAVQHVSGEELIPGYVNKEEHDVMMRERVETTTRAMQKLQKDGIQLGPFIELGAERGQRSLVLTNDFNVQGFAVDASFAQLRTLDYWMKFFNKPKGPIRICCDVHHLPFQNNALNFSFCYQFLHHFPDPTPVLKEVYRVLSSGYFFFDEEPFKRYSLKLYRRKVGNKPGTLRKYLRYLESFIADQYETEEEHGIIENDDMPLSQWFNALKVFDEKQIHLQSAERFFSEVGKVSAAKMRLHKMLGGGISGLMKKTAQPTNQPSFSQDNIYDLLGCPEQGCRIDPEKNHGRDRATLVKHEDCFICESCHTRFPIVDHIIFLLPAEELKQLYPQLVV